MTLDPSPPVCTDESAIPEERGLPSAPGPVIELPHRWDESGQLLPGTSPSECYTCRWGGNPESFWDHDRIMDLTCDDIMREPINCASCKLIRCILFKRAEIMGRQVAEKRFYVEPGFYFRNVFDGEPEDLFHSVFVPSDTPKTDIGRYNITRRFISNGDSLNHRSSEWAREHLTACASSHELCKSQSGDYSLPTRLINLQPDWKGLDVRLESSSCVRSGSSYVALSYCWGGYRPACITTVETLAQNMTRIPWEKLPATFQDAAAFTLSLEIQYLWIDSVCIIQDDEEDWRREAGKMYAVYKNSYLTLAALSGSDSTSGLRNMSLKEDSHLLAELRIAQNVYSLYIRRAHYLDSPCNYRSMDYSERKAIVTHYPLLGRAWAYQERTVSPRVMFFTESEMIFQCLESAECECGAAKEWCEKNVLHPSYKTSIFLQTESDSLKLKGRDIVYAPLRDDIPVGSCRAWQIANDWRSAVVMQYSVLGISMPRDRLPALAAIAEQFQRARVGEVYLAGLWSRSLHDDLLWACVVDNPSLKKSKAELERPFSLPTWSWASLQCSVSFPQPGVSVPLAEILEADCSYVGDSGFGVLQSSNLILRGRILDSIIEWSPNHGYFSCSLCSREGDVWGTEYPDRAGDPWTNLRIQMDMDNDGAQRIPPCQEIYIFEISETTRDYVESSRIDWHFLLLRCVDLDGFVYTRAGTATIYRRRDANQYDRHQGGFECAFEARSVLTTCEIR